MKSKNIKVVTGSMNFHHVAILLNLPRNFMPNQLSKKKAPSNPTPKRIPIGVKTETPETVLKRSGTYVATYVKTASASIVGVVTAPKR